MNHYTAIRGTITQIETAEQNRSTQVAASGHSRPTGGTVIFSSLPCTTVITLQAESQDQGPVHILLPSTAYVLGLHPFQVGDRATFFYESAAPMPLIYPPRYTAAAGALTPYGTTAVLEYFCEALVNDANTLQLTPAWNTPVTLPNGQTFAGNLGGNLLLATYTASTKSLPAQAMPEQIVVFCS